MLRERRDLAPLIDALAAQVPALSRALSDDSVEVRRLAARTLENMGTARDLLQRPFTPLTPPPVKQGRGATEEPSDGPTLDRGVQLLREGKFDPPVTPVGTGSPQSQGK